jgi:hypothetical protein
MIFPKAARRMTCIGRSSRSAEVTWESFEKLPRAIASRKDCDQISTNGPSSNVLGVGLSDLGCSGELSTHCFCLDPIRQAFLSKLRSRVQTSFPAPNTRKKPPFQVAVFVGRGGTPQDIYPLAWKKA